MISRNLRYLSVVEKRILFILTGIVSGTLIGLLVYYNLTGSFPVAGPLLLLILGAGITGLGIQVILFKVSRIINAKLSWQEQFSLRFGLEVIINGIIAILIASSVLLLVLFLITNDSVPQIFSTYWQSFVVLAILSLVFILVYTIITLLFFAHFHYAEGQIGELKAERKQLKLQFEALKNQLSPHYLFNSLNTISSLLYQDKNSAEEFIRRLADTYQYILSTHQKQVVPLSEELNFVKAYYYLLCVRYKEGLKLQINIPDNLMTCEIPPMTLQILVENAIKHNSFSINEPLIIELNTIGELFIRVSNNKTIRPANVKSTKVGLKNIELRYRFLTPKKIKVNDGQKFEVKIPLLTQNSTKAA